MIEINSFGVLGGDQRQASMAESMAADGYPVLCAGLEHVKGKNLKKAGWQEGELFVELFECEFAALIQKVGDLFNAFAFHRIPPDFIFRP